MPYTVLTDRLGTTTPQYYVLHEVIPEHLRTNERFMEFLEAYLEWQQSTVYSPGSIINKLVDIKNIDNVAEEFIPYIQRAVAGPIPAVAGVDRRKLYKQIIDLYLAKGSLPSYEALFNILFQDQIELYFPRVDMLQPSSGKWNDVDGRYADNNGFLSDRKYLQDSYYYQDYSYVIKTSKSFEAWKDIVTKVLHPAGFIFFGQIKVVSVPPVGLQKLKMKLVQIGRVVAEEATRPIILDTVSIPIGIAETYRELLGIVVTPVVGEAIEGLTSKPALALGPTFKHFDQYKFLIEEFASNYDDVVLEGPCLGLKTNFVPVLNRNVIDETYENGTTILMSSFLTLQPADLAGSSYNETIDLLDPTSGSDVVVELN